MEVDFLRKGSVCIIFLQLGVEAFEGDNQHFGRIDNILSLVGMHGFTLVALVIVVVFGQPLWTEVVPKKGVCLRRFIGIE